MNLEFIKNIKQNNKPVLAVIAPDSLPIPAVQGGSIQTIIYDYLKQLSLFQVVIFSRLVKNVKAYEVDEYGIKHIRISNYSWQNLDLVWQGDFIFRWSGYLSRIKKYLKQIKPDIVHVHNRPHWIPIINTVLPEKTKILLTNHNQKINEDRYVLKQIKKIIEVTDLFVYPSKKIAELDLLNKFPESREKVKFIYNAINIELFKKCSKEQIKKLKDKYNLNNSLVLLFVGRLVKEKAIDKILEAMPLVLKEEKAAKLLIVGSSFFAGAKDTPFIKELKKNAEPVKNSVRFTGFINNDQLPEIYSIADVFVSPVNWDDPSPKTIYEAAACECPIVSTKRGGIPEIVDEESAVLLDSPYEIKDLADTILNLLRDPETRVEMGQNARRRMEANFSIEIILKNWQEAYAAVL